MPQNNAQYPNAGVQTFLYPTSTLGVVSKWQPASKFREEEEIVNEDGTLAYVVGVDAMNEVEIELVMYPNQNVPTALTNINFNYNGVNGGGNIGFLIRGDVKITGTAGKSKRVSFKAINNSALP